MIFRHSNVNIHLERDRNRKEISNRCNMVGDVIRREI